MLISIYITRADTTTTRDPKFAVFRTSTHGVKRAYCSETWRTRPFLFCRDIPRDLVYFQLMNRCLGDRETFFFVFQLSNVRFFIALQAVISAFNQQDETPGEKLDLRTRARKVITTEASQEIFIESTQYQIQLSCFAKEMLLRT